MRYVIWNHTQRKYVAQPGLPSSFTSDIRKARQFQTREQAFAECCGDERVERWNGLERFG